MGLVETLASYMAASLPTPSAQFALTRWSVVLAAGDWRAGSTARRAMGELAQTYWYPLYAYLRRNGQPAAQAEDLVQGFFTRLMEKDALNAVDRGKGRFRSFLLASLKNFMSDEWDKSRRLKRGGGQKVLDLDALDADTRYNLGPTDLMTPERVFAQRWALTVLEQVMARLRQEYESQGKAPLFNALQGAIAGSAERLSYAEIATQLAMSESAVKMAAHRLRRDYRRILRDEIAQTVASPDLIDDEIRFLMESL